MKRLELFDYQEEIVVRVEHAFTKHLSVMVQMPTGTGKTHLLAAIVMNEMKRGKMRNVWIVAHRRELVAQIDDTLRRFFSKDEQACTKVMSIQWLTLHYREMRELPSMIIIDEAHHAVANTYAEVMAAFHDAKKLGLTATPCRLNGQGFTDLFDVLLTSWSMERFIAEGRLSTYDYYSIKPDSEEQRLINSLKKRGADGDYQQKEMSEVMDVRPSIERLCQTVKRYVPRDKGIVYAFSIAHAEHIAEHYSNNGICAVAISSKTPLEERRRRIEDFRQGGIQVLVSVDLFSEGFDCPDVQFVQLARPTLSLSKYLQMVGRGLRVARGKMFCVILDNVGLYRRFGMPSSHRDWQSMFEGRQPWNDMLQEACMRINRSYYLRVSVAGDDEEVMKIMGHDRQRLLAACRAEDDIVKDDNGWTDMRSGLRFAKQPRCVDVMGVEFCTENGRRFYPRIRSRYVDETAYINMKALELQVGRGIKWKRRFIAADEPNKVYWLKEKTGSVRLYVDDDGASYVQANPDAPLCLIISQEEMNAYCDRYSKEEREAMHAYEQLYRHGRLYPIHGHSTLARDMVEREDGDIWKVDNDVFGESYWVDVITGTKHYARPRPLQRGFVSMLRDGEWYYVRNIPDLAGKPMRNWQIEADDNICVINGEYLFLKQDPRMWFKIVKHTDDFSYFVVKEYNGTLKSTYAMMPDIIITQDLENRVKMESKGVPYVPHFIFGK